MTSTTESESDMTARLAVLARLADGRACPAGVASVLERFAAGRMITSHDVHYVIRGAGGYVDARSAMNFYARLRAAGLDIPGGSDNIPSGGKPDDYPAVQVSLVPVRDALRDAAAALVAELDASAERIAVLDRAYARELGW